MESDGERERERIREMFFPFLLLLAHMSCFILFLRFLFFINQIVTLFHVCSM